ncbi:MAG: hypothetical protein U0X73_11170 [Thermoanaerobaculia bacterium]
MLIPWQAAVRNALANHEFPLWNPFMSGGDPLLASMQPAPGFFPVLVSLLLPLEEAAGFVLLVTFLVAGLGFYLLLRDLQVRQEAAVVGAVALELSKYLVFWSHWNVGYATSVAPWVLLAARKLARQPSVRSVIVSVLSASMLVVAGHPETVLVLTIPVVLCFLFSLRDRMPRKAARSIGAAGIASLLALGLTAPLSFPFLEALPQSFEEGFRKTALYRSVVGALPVSDAMDRIGASFLPFTRGVLGEEIPRKAQGGFSGDEATGYCGTVAFGLVALGIGRRRRGVKILITSISLTGLLLACRVPWTVTAMQRLPLFDQLVFDYFYVWPALGFSALAALGFDDWLERAPATALGRIGSTTLLYCVAAAAVYPGLRQEGLSRGFLVSQSLVAILPLAALMLLDRLRSRALAALALVLALLVGQRLLESEHQFPSVARRQFYPVVAPVDIAMKLAGEARVTALDDILVPNTPTMYGLRDVRGYNAISLRRLRETFPLWVKPGSVIFNRLAALDTPFLTFLHVAYVFAPSGTTLPRGWKVVAEANGTQLLENPRAGANAYLPELIHLGGTAANRIDAMAKSTSLEDEAWIDPGDGVEQELRDEPNGPGEVTCRFEGSGYRIQSRLERDAWIVVPTTHWKGWRAYVGERELEVAYANHAFVAIHAPAGEHEIRLIYLPSSWLLGLRIAGGSLAVSLIGALAAWRKGPQTAAPS